MVIPHSAFRIIREETLVKVEDLEVALNQIAPPKLAAEWDNIGLLIGDRDATLRTAMLCIDLTPAVLAEARAAKADMVVAYHPPIFKPLARVTAQATPVVYQAVRSGLAVYSPHTALDAVIGGTNDVLASVLGLKDAAPLEPVTQSGLCKIAAFVQPDNLQAVAEAAWAAGGGHIGNYDRCSFQIRGQGTFRGLAGTNPTIGVTGKDEITEEVCLEMIAPLTAAPAVVAAMRNAHSYEEPAVDVYPLTDVPQGQGAGRVGQLPKPASVDELVRRVKKAIGLKNVLIARGEATRKETAPTGRPARMSSRHVLAAVAAGSCGSMFKEAIRAGATFYLTGEMRHHDLLAATQAGMTCVCVGHSNSERLTLKMLSARIQEQLPKLKVVLSKADRDPLEFA